MSGGCNGGKPQVWRFKGSEDGKVQCREGAMVGGHKCRRLKLS